MKTRRFSVIISMVIIVLVFCSQSIVQAADICVYNKSKRDIVCSADLRMNGESATDSIGVLVNAGKTYCRDAPGRWMFFFTHVKIEDAEYKDAPKGGGVTFYTYEWHLNSDKSGWVEGNSKYFHMAVDIKDLKTKPNEYPQMEAKFRPR